MLWYKSSKFSSRWRRDGVQSGGRFTNRWWRKKLRVRTTRLSWWHGNRGMGNTPGTLNHTLGPDAPGVITINYHYNLFSALYARRPRLWNTEILFLLFKRLLYIVSILELHRRGQKTTQKIFWLIKTPSLSTSTGTLTPSRCTRSGSHKLTKIWSNC